MYGFLRPTATWTIVAAWTVALWLGAAGTGHAQNVDSKTAAGQIPSAIQPVLDQLRAKLGGNNNGTGGSFRTGRREIAWDDVPDDKAAPADLPEHYFNTTVPRGVVISGASEMQVSMDDDTGFDPDPDMVRFGHIRSQYAAQFQTFSAQRLFTPIGRNVTELTFFVPGTDVRATVKGFGVVFIDVDLPNQTRVEVLDTNDVNRGTFYAPPGAFSAVTVYNPFSSYDIGRIRITTGTAAVGDEESSSNDVVVLDDLIVGEPQAPRFDFGYGFNRALESQQPIVTFSVAREGFTSTPATVTLTPAGNATIASDYVLPVTTLAFAAGEKEKTFEVRITNDALREGLEMVQLTLKNPSNGHVIGAENRADILIVDDEVPPPGIHATTSDNRLVRFSIVDARTLASDVPITGLAPNEIIVGLDYRPSDGLLYGVGSSSRLYRITPGATSATALALGPTPFSPGISGTKFGADFDPVLDQLRVVSDTGVNLRLDPRTGRVVGNAHDSPLAFAAGDPHQGAAPKVTGLAYTNNVAGASTTVAYGVEATTRSIVKLDPANAGVVRTVASYGSISVEGGMDIEPRTNFAFVMVNPELSLARVVPFVGIVDLATGRAYTVSHDDVKGMLTGEVNELQSSEIVAATLIPSNAVLDNDSPAITISDVTVAEGARGAADVAVTVSLTKTSTVAVTVNFATADGTATAHNDYVPVSGTLTLAPGTLTQAIQVPIIGDGFVESGAQTFVVNLTTPEHARIGDDQGVVTITEDDTQPSYLFAEGATGAFFDLDILLANPHAMPAPVTLTFLTEDGLTLTHDLTLAATSRTTVRVDDIAGLESKSVSTLVTSTSGLPLVVERTMRWDASGYGAHTEKAVEGSALRWYFAEGSQGFFSTYLLLANPNASANTATVEYLREGDTPVTRTYEIGPRARLTVDAGADPALVDRSFGMSVTFAQPGVAERAMYFGRDPLWKAGHESAGATNAATQWFLAEGATGAYFDTFVLLSNPQPTAAEVTLTYLLAGGAPIVRTKTVPASGRLTVNLEQEDPALADAAVGTQVVSSTPIIVERAQYWPFTPDQWHEAHNSFGLEALGTSWGLAEGRTGGAARYQTYILLANPGSMTSNVTIAFLRTDGTTVTKQFSVPPASRLNVATGADGPVPELADEEFAAIITSSQPIAVERAMYLDAGGVVWAAGTNATATRLP